MKIFYFLRVHFKLLKRTYFQTNSFCKHCGRDIRDYHCPDEIWELVEPYIKNGHSLCYNCFCDICTNKLNIEIPRKLIYG